MLSPCRPALDPFVCKTLTAVQPWSTAPSSAFKRSG
jgi:hypothetical protein